MTRTSELLAHYAGSQLDTVLRAVVTPFQRMVDALIAEARERGASFEERQRLFDSLMRYRAIVLELGDTLGGLRAHCGTDPGELPADEDDVRAELARIRAAHERAQRQPGHGWPGSTDPRGGERKDGGR